MIMKKEIAIVLVMALLLAGVWLLVSRVESANDGAQTPTAYTRVGHLVAAAASGATVVRVRLG